MSALQRNKASHMLSISLSGTVMPWLHVRPGALTPYHIAVDAGEDPRVAAFKANVIAAAKG